MAAAGFPRLTLIVASVALFCAALGAAAPADAAAGQKHTRTKLAGSGKGIAIHQARAVSRQGRCLRRSRKARRGLSVRQRRNESRRLRRCRSRRATPSGPGGPIYWGAWIGSHLTGTEAPWDANAIATLEQKAGKELSIVNFSSPFADCSKSPCSFYDFPAGPMDDIREHGAIPFFSWGSQSTPATLNQPEFQLSDVIAGRHDTYIRNWAIAAREWGHPFFLRFNWEMNGGWFAWAEGVNGNKSGEFVAAWRHVHDIFAAVGATNATWVWCPNVDPHDKMQDLDEVYPGDAYVDWTGLDGYNWGTNPTSPKGWMSFDELFRSTYDEIVGTIAPSKPLIVSEVGSSEYGGSKAAWIADALHSARTEYPQLRGLLWFEKYDDGMDWPIVTSSGATGAFAAGIQDATYLTNSFASMESGTIQPSG